MLDWADDAWVQRGGDLDGENKWDYSGYSLAMSADGDTLASGARHTDDAGRYAGHARIFGWIDSAAGAPTDAPTPAPTDVGCTRARCGGRRRGHRAL